MTTQIIAGTIRMMKPQTVEGKEVKVLTDVEVTIEEAYKFVTNYVRKAFRRGYFRIRRKNGTYLIHQVSRNKSWDLIPDIVQYIMTGNGGDFIDVGHNADKWEHNLPKYQRQYAKEKNKEGQDNTYAVRKGWIELQGKCSIARLLKSALSRTNAAKGYWASKYYKINNGTWVRCNRRDYIPDHADYAEVRYHPRSIEETYTDSKDSDFVPEDIQWMRTYVRNLDARSKAVMLQHLQGFNTRQIGVSMNLSHVTIQNIIRDTVAEMRTAALGK